MSNLSKIDIRYVDIPSGWCCYYGDADNCCYLTSKVAGAWYCKLLKVDIRRLNSGRSDNDISRHPVYMLALAIKKCGIKMEKNNDKEES